MIGHLVPRQVFFTSGTGVHRDKLVSFELALRAARIHRFNLVTVSSIFPPGAELVSIDEGLTSLSPGEIVFCVLSQNATRDPGRQITASVGLALPAKPNHHGYLSEHDGRNETEQQSGACAERLAVIMLATALGLQEQEDPDGEPFACEDIREFIKGTQSITQSATGDPEGRWTTVVSAAVLVP